MFQKLVSHNPDLCALVEKAYAVAFDSNHLIVRDIPYLDAHGHLQIGALVAKLEFTDQDHVVQTDHQVLFAGSVPYELDGTPIRNLGGGPCSVTLSEASKDVVVERSFSNKPLPVGAFRDFFEKIESYVAIIAGPAMTRHGVTPFTSRCVRSDADDSVFKIHDTLTSRADITDLAAKFKDDVVAVIGLGGTGAYLLDLLVKTPVRQIRGFDADLFHVHNAFRSPGKLDINEFRKTKAEIYGSRYENFRHGLSVSTKLIDSTSADNLKGVTFAFVCVDNGSSRSAIFDVLLSLGIPFIDVGMGLKRREGSLTGMVRATYYSVENGIATREKQFAAMNDNPDDLYRANIQIAELNALNACLALLKFKQIRGFYFDEQSPYHMLFCVGDMKIWGTGDGDAV